MPAVTNCDISEAHRTFGVPILGFNHEPAEALTLDGYAKEVQPGVDREEADFVWPTRSRVSQDGWTHGACFGTKERPVSFHGVSCHGAKAQTLETCSLQKRG
jgi:hypothetical protein